MAKVRITKELDSKNAQYFKLTKKRGKITAREAFEAMEESYYFGEYLIQFNVPEEAPMDLYEDGMIGVSYYHHGWSNRYESVFDIIAWQPLPEPYREEQEDE